MAPAELSVPSQSARPQRRTPAFGSSMTGSAVLAIEGQQVAGLVMSPHAELGLFLFVPDAPDAYTGDVEEGSMVRIRWRGAAGFDAVAEVIEVDDRERWILSVPVPLQSTKTRQNPRLLADGAWTLLTEDGDLLDVYDLSARGVGIEFPCGEGPAGVGDCLVGVLRADTLGYFEVRMECTNVRPHPEDGRLWIVGGRLVISDRNARRQYQATLAILGE